MSNRIAELRRKRAALVAEMKAIVEKETDDAPLTDEDRSRFDEIERSIEEHDDRISRLEKLNQVEADESDEVEASVELAALPGVRKSKVTGPVIKHARPTNEVKGTRLARFVIGAGLSKAAGSRGAGAEYVSQHFEDAEVSKALTAGTFGQGGALIPQDFRNELIDLLMAATVVRGSGAQVLPMPMGNLTIPRLSTAATAYWQGEITDATVSQPSFDDLQLAAHKLVAMVPVSNDLIRRAPLSVEAIVRQHIVRMLARAEDLAFLSGSGTGNQPTGMITLAGSTATYSATPTLSVVNNALMSMELSLRGQNVPTDKAVWFAHPQVRSFLSTLTDSTGRFFYRDELDRGKLLGYDVRETTQLPTNLAFGSYTGTNLVFAATDQLIIADTLNTYADSSMEASYMSGASLVSAYSQDQTVFRVINEVDFNVQHPAAVAVGAVCGWIPSGSSPAAGAAFDTQAANTSPSAAPSSQG